MNVVQQVTNVEVFYALFATEVSVIYEQSCSNKVMNCRLVIVVSHFSGEGINTFLSPAFSSGVSFSRGYGFLMTQSSQRHVFIFNK